MKRIFCILIAALLCLSMAACKTVGDPTPAEINEKTLKVGIICATDEKTAGSEAAAYREQLFVACRNTGLLDDQMMVKSNVSVVNSALAEEAIEECVRAGCAIVFGTAPGFETALKNKAAQYPRVTFVGLGNADATLPNYYAVQLKLYEGAYFCGLVAGVTTETNKLGLLAQNADSVETRQIANAFLLGARVANPDATVEIAATDVVSSDSREQNAVLNLKSAQCDVVLVALHSATAVKNVTDNRLMALSLSTRPVGENEYFLYSATPRLTDWFVDTIFGVLDKTKPYYNDMSVGYADGFIDWQAGSVTEWKGDAQLIPSKVQTYMNKNGWDPFSGVALTYSLGELTAAPAAVKDAAGEQKIAPSAGAPSRETLDGMNWLAEGVSVLK